MSERIEFEKMHNTRDLGGEITTDGQRIRRGRLFRSGMLTGMTKNDERKLSSQVDTVIDFRSEQERKENPEVILPGITYHHIPVVDDLTIGISRESEADNRLMTISGDPKRAKHYMCTLYRFFPTSEFAMSQYARFFRILLDTHEKAVLWHCTAGKDRAGIASAILEEILGVPRQKILSEYLFTNECLADDITRLLEQVGKHAPSGVAISEEALRYLFGADMAYIETFYQAVEEFFGDFNSFVQNGLKLTTEEIQRLRTMYLEV
ncbi:MAG: tyrosine-protein phosphatase [Lachnospiraceae bacterium]|nr:tyrosine-protein phosphatase [Lachnospiraceae bacterium]